MKALFLFFLLASASAFAKPAFIVQKNPQLPLTVINLTFRVGSADDPAGQEGIAALTAQMIREGGVKQWKNLPARTRSQIEDLLFPIAADIGLSVGTEQTALATLLPAEEAEGVFDVLSQMVLSPAFDEKEFDRLRAEAIDGLEKQLPQEDQEELGKTALYTELYGAQHPYSHHVAGRLESVKKIEIGHIKEFYSKIFSQDRLTVGLAGVVSSTLESKARTVFRTLPEKSEAGRKATVPPAAKPLGTHLTLVEGPFTAVGVHIGLPLDFNRSDLKTFSRMFLAATAFGKHRSFVGRLMREVREIRGLNYGAYAYTEDFPHGGSRLMEPNHAGRQRQAFTVWGRPTTMENGCFLLRQVHRELKDLKETGLTKEEFELGKNHLVGSIPLLATSLDRQLGYAIDAQFYGIKGSYLAMLQNEVGKATLEEVRVLLQSKLDIQNAHLVVVTPEADRFQSEILGERCDIRYGAGVEKPADVLAEDQKIATHSLGLSAEKISKKPSKAYY